MMCFRKLAVVGFCVAWGAVAVAAEPTGSVLSLTSPQRGHYVVRNGDVVIVNDQVRELVDGTLAHAEELDGIIAQYSKTRALNRIPKLNVAILRIALYEILYDDGTPQNAAINEAVELAKNYTYQEDVGFINGLLGAYARDHAEQA